MRQTSTDFMAKMLEDNTPIQTVDHAAEIDKRIDAALSRFANELDKISKPAPTNDAENIINEKENNEDDTEGNAEGSRDTGAGEEAPEDDN